MAFADPAKNLRQFALRSGMDVADLGAGPGAYALAAAEIVGTSGHVFAVEIQKNLVQKVRAEADSQNMDNISVVWGDIEKLEGTTLADDSVDVVLLSNVLFQAKDVPAVFSEAKRILRDDGFIFVIDWSDSFGGLGPQEDHLISADEIARVVKDLGLKVVSDVDVGAHHWGIKLKK